MRWGALALLISACGGGAGNGEPDGAVHDAGLPDQPMLQSPIDMRLLSPVVISGQGTATYFSTSDSITMTGLAAGDGVTLRINGVIVPLEGGNWTFTTDLPPYACDGTSPLQDVLTIRATNALDETLEEVVTVLRYPCLPLGAGWIGGMVTGSESRYAPSCAGSAEPERIYRLNVTGAAGEDLVVDVREPAQGNDTKLEISTDATPAGSFVGCIDRAYAGGGEVAVIPNVENRDYFVVVDSAGQKGAFEITAYLRAVVPLDGACDRPMVATRCAQGYCRTTPEVTTPHCLDLTAVAEDEDSELSDDFWSSTPFTPTNDFVLTGVALELDDDYIEVTVNSELRRRLGITVYGLNGGCNSDTELWLDSVTVDDDSGLGSCPFFETGALTLGTHRLSVSKDNFAKPFAPRSYTLVIDYHGN